MTVLEGWALAKFLAWERQGGVCTICNKRIYLDSETWIGHHVVNRSKGGANTAENCEARHKDCETLAHRQYRDGNPRGNLIRFPDSDTDPAYG